MKFSSDKSAIVEANIPMDMSRTLSSFKPILEKPVYKKAYNMYIGKQPETKNQRRRL